MTGHPTEKEPTRLPSCIRLVPGINWRTVNTPVVSYSRISDDGENDEHGVRNQHRRNSLTAQRLGWTVVAEITDNDITAAKADVVREGFEAIIQGLRVDMLPDGTKFVGVVTAVQDRAFRRATDYERFVDVFIDRPGHVFADHRGPLDLYSETVEGMGLVGVVFSKMEARKISRRLRDFHRDRIMDGKPPAGGNRPFGWLEDRVTMHPIEGPLLAKAAHDHLAGRSLNAIVREWQAKDIRTTTGRPWTTKSLKVALRNPRMCGWRRVNGEIVRDPTGQPYVGKWDRLIEPETWLAVDALFNARAGKQVAPAGILGDLPIDFGAHRHLLTGTIICGKSRDDGTMCGAKLRINYQKHCKGHSYSCLPKSNGGCAGVAIQGPLTDKYITEAVLAKLEERAALEYREQPWPRETELSNAEDMFAALRHQWHSGLISNEMYFTDARILEEKINSLRKEKGKHLASAHRSVTDVADVRARWSSDDPEHGLDLSRKRRYIQSVLHAVIVRPAKRRGPGFDPDRLELVWKQSLR